MNRTELLAAVRRSAKVAPEKSTLGILANVRIGDGMIAATDLNTTIVHKIDAGIRACVSARKLGDFLAALEGDDIKLTVNAKGALTVSNGKKRRFQLQTFPVEDFPEVKRITGKARSFKSADIVTAINAAKHSVGTDPLKPGSYGVALSLGDEIGAATVRNGGHALAVYGAHAQGECKVIPTPVIPMLLDLLSNSETIDVVIDGHDVSFRGAYELTTRIANEMFPPADVILKTTKYAHDVQINREMFIAGVRACTAAAGTDAPVVLKFTPTELQLRLLNSKEALEAYDVVACECDREIEPICCEGKYLIDAAGAVDAETLTVRCTGELDPLAIVAPKYECIVMPRREFL